MFDPKSVSKEVADDFESRAMPDHSATAAIIFGDRFQVATITRDMDDRLKVKPRCAGCKYEEVCDNRVCQLN